MSFSVNIWPCTTNIWLFRKYLAVSDLKDSETVITVTENHFSKIVNPA